jgi:transcriptional regulator GlxA family with amidase domain
MSSSNLDIRRRETAGQRPHRIAMLVYPGAQILDISGPLEVFARTARWLSDRRVTEAAYSVDLIAEQAGPVRTSGGIDLLVHHGLDAPPPMDTLLVTGGVGYAEVCRNPSVLRWIVSQAACLERVGSICTGALILGSAGLLEGREATTHWRYLDQLARIAPGCRVRDDALYVQSGNLITSAGVTAGIDLALAVVESDFGKATAVAIAEELVVYRRRSGEQPQLSAYLKAERRNDIFGQLELWVLDHLSEDLSVERLAEVARMSPRHFSRRFKSELGITPADFVTRARVQEARRRMQSGAASLKDIARQCGFRDEQALRRAFRRELGVLPTELLVDGGLAPSPRSNASDERSESGRVI